MTPTTIEQATRLTPMSQGTDVHPPAKVVPLHPSQENYIPHPFHPITKTGLIFKLHKKTMLIPQFIEN